MGLLNGKLIFKTLPEGSPDKTKVICHYCLCELLSHCNTLSLKYLLQVKLTADAETLISFCQRQTNVE